MASLTGAQKKKKKNPYLLFVQDLHRIELVCFFVFDEHNSAEGAGAQSLEPVEIVQACCALRKHICHWKLVCERGGCRLVLAH